MTIRFTTNRKLRQVLIAVTIVALTVTAISIPVGATAGEGSSQQDIFATSTAEASVGSGGMASSGTYSQSEPNESTAVVERSLSNGTVYQTGWVSAAPSSVEPGDSVTVTGRIEANINIAGDNIVYGVLGLDDGTTLDVQRMSSTGSGTVTTTATIPSNASGEELVWSFFPVPDEETARENFGKQAAGDLFLTGANGIRIATVGEQSAQTESVNAPVEREFANGTIYQTGRAAPIGDTVEPGSTLSVTGKVDATHQAATSNPIYAVVGTPYGTIIGAAAMESRGSGTVTVNSTVPDAVIGQRLVWTFFVADTETEARSEFVERAVVRELVGGNESVVITTVSNETNPSAAFESEPISFRTKVTAAQMNSESTSYEWDFGDGNSASGRTAVHTYSDAGRYNVTLTVTDEFGTVNSTTKTVQIPGDWAMETYGASNVTIRGSDAVSLSTGDCGVISLWKNYGDREGTASLAFDYEYDVEGATPDVRIWGAEHAASFDIGTGGTSSGQFERTVPVDDTVMVNFVLESSGDGNSGCAGAADVNKLNITEYSVNLAPEGESGANLPTAAFTASETESEVGVPLTFDASSSSDDGTITKYEWAFSDGTTATGREVDHEFDIPGNYLVELTVTDDDGGIKTTERRIQVRPATDEENTTDKSTNKTDLRTIAYGQTKSGFIDTGDPKNEAYLGGTRYEPVTFDGEKGDIISVDVESSGSPAVRLWDPSGTAVANESLSTYELQSNGTYTIEVGLWATDTGAYDLSLTRHNDEIPRATIELNTSDPGTQDEIAFEASVSTDGTVDSYEWTFGDGSSADGAEVTHSYEQAGTYTVELVVTTDEGLTDTATREVVVESALKQRYDEDGDGLEISELQTALDDLTGKDPSESDIEVSEVRKLIDDFGDTPVEDTENGTRDTDGDGLPDELEKRGIPVYSTYQLSNAGADTNLAEPLGSDADGIKRIKTDPYDADTDDDGRLDGEEVGQKKTTSYPENQTYYTLKSDPSDPNTDDTGLNDSAEMKKGSDPKSPEYFSVNAILPVVGKEGCDPGTAVDPNNCGKFVTGTQSSGGTYGLKPVATHNYDAGDDPPGWLKGIDESKLQDDHPYYLIPVQIETSESGGRPQALPEHLQILEFTGSATIVGAGSSRSEIVDSDRIDPFDGGSGRSTTIYIAVRAEGVRADNANYLRFGKLKLALTTPKGMYTRGDHSGEEQREIVTTKNSFGVKSSVSGTSKAEARAMVDEASRKFGQQTIAASFPVTGGALGGANLGVLSSSQVGGLVVTEGVATLSGIGDKTPPGPDDLVGQEIVAEGTVPAYLRKSDDGTPTANVAITVYRAN